LAIVDLIANECGLALARALGLPVVSFWGFGYQGGEVMYTSTWNSASIVPAFMTGMDRNMNFLQRSVNLLFYFTHAVLEYWQASISDIYIKESYPELGSSAQLIHGIDLALVNLNFFIDYPRLSAPNTKYVGPMHLKEAQLLPPKFQNFVDGAEHGVILLSLGFTGFLPHDIPRETMDGFLEAFSRIKQRVIMKFDPKVLSYIPKNVMVVDWFPQIDLLGHNNTLLFISHCGMNGVSEAIYHRVPILGMPIFADQADNAIKLKDRGIGLVLDRHNIEADDVIYKIDQLINNPKYKTQVDRFADMWRDERFTPIEEATYWIELLHKYGNLDHLRINDGNLNLIQYLCLDVVIFWSALCVLFIYVTFTTCRRYWLRSLVELPLDPDFVNNNKKKQ
jgi:glucuronosyltransferase